VPRSLWTGAISFGLVNVPVRLFTAVRTKDVRFHQRHAADGVRIKQKRICPADGEEVAFDDIVKGFEIAEGEYVVLTKEEVKAAAGERTKTIPIEEFVPAHDIDPVFFSKTYYVGPREGGEAAYKALQTALEETGRAGIGRMTFHDREYLVAVRALDGVLGLHQLRFADEVATKKELELNEPGRGPSDREVKMAGALVDSLETKWTPDEYEDTYRERVVEMIEAKAKGKQVVRPKEEEPAEESDLLAALEASLKGMKS